MQEECLPGLDSRNYCIREELYRTRTCTGSAYRRSRTALWGLGERDCFPKSTNASEHSDIPVRNREMVRLDELVIPQQEELPASYANPTCVTLIDLPQTEIYVVEMSPYAQPGLQGSPTPTDTSSL